MRKILFVNACIRPNSRTYYLAQKVLEKLDGEITEVCLCRENLIPLCQKQLEERNTQLAAQNYSAPLFQYARQFAAADEIVIAAPYWDLAFPSVLRIYFEYITVTGLTFRYTAEGVPVGLCKAKRIIYVTTAGGTIGNRNLGYDYIKALSKAFYGIPNVQCFQAENLDIQGADVGQILQKAVQEIENSNIENLETAFEYMEPV